MPKGAVMRWPGGHRKETSNLELLHLQEEVQLLKEEADEAAENMELARLAAKTLEEQFRTEQATVVQLRRRSTQGRETEDVALAKCIEELREELQSERSAFDRSKVKLEESHDAEMKRSRRQAEESNDAMDALTLQLTHQQSREHALESELLALRGSEATLQAQLQSAESRHEGRDLADADAQTTPEGEAEQTATILVKDFEAESRAQQEELASLREELQCQREAEERSVENQHPQAAEELASSKLEVEQLSERMSQLQMAHGLATEELQAKLQSARPVSPGGDNEALQQELELARTQVAEAEDAAEVLQQVKDSLTLQLTQQQSKERELETELLALRGSEATLQAQLQSAESRHEGRDLADADAQTTPEGEAEQTATILVKDFEAESRAQQEELASLREELQCQREAEERRVENQHPQAEEQLLAEELFATKVVEELASSREEVAQLSARMEDLDFALQIASEAAAEDSSCAIREACRLRSECRMLEGELGEARETSQKSPKTSGVRVHRPTADFGDATELRRLQDGTGSAEMLSIAEEPDDEAFKSPVNTLPSNPFEDMDEPSERDPSLRRATAVSFAPPPRARSDSRNFSEDLWDETSLASEDMNVKNVDSSGGCSFGRASGGILPLPETQAVSSKAKETAEVAVNTEAPANEAKAEVQRLRNALISEEAACAEAKAELKGVGSGSDASDADRLRLLLSQEKAKIRELGARAIRSERHRQKLLEEMVQDGQADVELVSLAKAVGRTVKAISAISKEAPHLSKLAKAPLSQAESASKPPLPAPAEAPPQLSPRLSRLPSSPAATAAAAQSAQMAVDLMDLT